jgi:hypothetical protein
MLTRALSAVPGLAEHTLVDVDQGAVVASGLKCPRWRSRPFAPRVATVASSIAAVSDGIGHGAGVPRP